MNIAPIEQGMGDAPWFVDLALNSQEFRPLKGRVYATLDPALQRMALDAVRSGMKQVDAKVRGRNTQEVPEAALIALDPHTGEVKALVGGRNFAVNQVNHAQAMRQPGSAFKPFVYAAALASGRLHFSQATTVLDAPTTFRFEGQEYTPSNFGDRFFGQVTLRNALAESMNVATVSVAEQVGYDEVVRIARQAGLSETIKASPALALGAYEVTPVELGGAYTIFANGGTFVPPTFVSEVRSGSGDLLYSAKPAARQVLDRPTAFVVQDMLTEVMRSGTAAGVQAHGLNVPAAGKTGTSRDGWFAGYVSNLICVVWVGYDSGRDLDLEGAKSALPIWTEFMKQASQQERYRHDLGAVPDGVVAVDIDSATGLRSGPNCGSRRRAYFVRGSEPVGICSHEPEPAVVGFETLLRAIVAKIGGKGAE